MACPARKRITKKPRVDSSREHYALSTITRVETNQERTFQRKVRDQKSLLKALERRVISPGDVQPYFYSLGNRPQLKLGFAVIGAQYLGFIKKIGGGKATVIFTHTGGYTSKYSALSEGRVSKEVSLSDLTPV